MAVALLAALPAAHAQEQPGPPTDEVRLEELDAFEPLGGQVRSARIARVAFGEAGHVALLAVREGERVEEGMVVGRLDSGRAELEVKLAQARGAEAEARLAQAGGERDGARRRLERLRALVASSAAGRAEIEAAEHAVRAATAGLEMAAARREAARAQLDLARLRLQDHSLRVPFAGVVAGRFVEVGERVTAGQPALAILDPANLAVYLDVPPRLLSGLVGKRVTLEIDGAAVEEALPIEAAWPDADPEHPFAAARLSLANPDGRFLPGQRVRALVPLGGRAAFLTVAEAALLETPGGHAVQVAGGEAIKRVDVEVLFPASPGRVAIRAPGLRAEARVLMRPDGAPRGR